MLTLTHKKRKRRYRVNMLESVKKKSNLKVLYKRLTKRNRKVRPTNVKA